MLKLLAEKGVRNIDQYNKLFDDEGATWDAQSFDLRERFHSDLERQILVERHLVSHELGDGVRVVSMPSSDVFDRQDAAYREAVLPKTCRKRVAIEAGVSAFWRKYVGLDGDVVGIDTFGASAPIEALMPHFGFTVEHVVAVAQALRISRCSTGCSRKWTESRSCAGCAARRSRPPSCC